MLEFIRTHKRLSQVLLLIFIVPSFAFVGLEGYSRMTDSDNAVAKVAGQKISQMEWDNAQREHTERLRQEYGPQVDAKVFETPEFKNGVLESLLVEKAMSAEAGRRNLTIAEPSLQQAIMNIPGLTKSDGKFDSDRYKAFLAARGLTPAAFEASVRHDIVLQQIRGAVQSSAFVPKDVAARISDYAGQEREVQQLRFDSPNYVSKVTVTDEMITAFYEKNGSLFEIPEQMNVEYVIMTAASVAASITVQDSDIKAYYEQNAKRYSTDEQRRASHILITVKKDASDTDKAAAKTKAEGLLAQARKKPGDFAKLAKENSQDPGSAAKGGDLNFFGKGMMVKPFEETAFKLKKGEISDLVQSDFGYHIIMVTDTKGAATKQLSEVKNEIATDIKRQLMSKKFAEAAEVFSNTVYEQADSLKPAADKLKLKIETASGLRRELDPKAAPGTPYNNERFLKAMFSDETIKNKRNSEAVEIGPNMLIAGRVVDYKPKSMRPFEEVKAAIKERLAFEEATVLAKKDGEAKLAKLKESDDAAGFGEAKAISRAKRQGVHPAVLAAVLKADTTKLPTYVGVDFPLLGYGIYRITKVTVPPPDKARRQAEMQQMGGLMSQQEMIAYVNALKARAKAEILKPAKAAATSDGKS
jgi:peptidyl-prolyl cis-trans isomerase D